jgi:hypothetical protein
MGGEAILLTPALGLAILRVLTLLLLPVLPLAAGWPVLRVRVPGRAWLARLTELLAVLCGVLFAPALLRAATVEGILDFHAIFAPDGPWHLSFRQFVFDRALPLLAAPRDLALLLAQGRAGPDLVRGTILLSLLALLALLLPPLTWPGSPGRRAALRNLLLLFWAAYATVYTVALLLWLANLLNFWCFLVLFGASLLLRE